MFATRPTAPHIRFTVLALLLSAGTAEKAFSQSSATYGGEQWRPAGVTRSTHVPTPDPRSTKPSWQMPNSQAPTTAANTDDGESNPLRAKEKNKPNAASNAPQEPRAFQPPAHATRIAAAGSATPASASSQPQRQNPSAATTMSTTNTPSNIRQANAQSRTAAANRPAPPQRPVYQRPIQRNNVRQATIESPSESLWKTITVAFQGESVPTPTPAARPMSESLPMPSDARVEMQDPVMRHFDGPGAYIGPYSPYGEPGGCGDGNCNYGDGCGDGSCEPGCGCGCGEPCCGAEPGCGCEPGCSCDQCREDLFCIGPGDDESCHTVRFRWPKWQEVMVFGGVQGFKGPYDLDRDSGNFGFHEGFNIGAKIPYADLGYQFGWRGTQNQVNGDENLDIEEQHFQQFATAGVFHRQCDGFNFGVVWDVLSDERWHSKQFNQIRSEISFIDGGRHEIGFTATLGSNENEVEDDDGDEFTFKASDQYLLFYRLHGCNGGEGRFFAGFNDGSDGIIGADMLLPVGDRFSVSAGFTYLNPDAEDGEDGAAQEAWNLGLGLVWHWDQQARKSFENCYRPFFNVADNGTLIIDGDTD